MGSSGTSSSSLLPSSTVSTGCGKYSLTISSTDNVRDLLVATSLSKWTSPPVSRFSGANSDLSSYLASLPSSNIPLNGSLWSSIAPSWASNEIPNFRKHFRIVCSVTSPQAFLSVIIALKIDVRTSCLSLPTTLMIFQVTRDRYLPFNDLRERENI